MWSVYWSRKQKFITSFSSSSTQLGPQLPILTLFLRYLPSPELLSRRPAVQMNSDSSAVTADFSDAPSASSPTAPTGQSMVWTNEKHKKYLDLLETSFLEQLNWSRSLSKLLPQEKTWESCSFPCSSGMYEYDTEDQFMVLQGGHQQKMNTQGNEKPLDSTADSQDILGSPWIHHFKPAGKCIRSTSSRPQDVLGEEDKEEKMEKRRPRQRGRGSNSNLIDNTGLDQVVPFGTLGSVDDSANINTCTRKGKKRLQLECPRRTAAPKKLDMC